MLYEVYDTGGVLCPSSIPVTSLGRIAKEGRVAHIGRWLPMPITWVPWEVSDEPRFKNLENWWFFTWLHVLGQPERRPVAVLSKRRVTEYTIGSKVVASSQARGVVCQVSPSSPVAVPTPKKPRMSSNHFVWFHASPCE